MWKKTFIFIFIAQLCTHIGLDFAIPFLPFFIAELGVFDLGEQAFWAGIVLGATGITFAFSAPFWGMIADRHGRKAMVCRSMFALTVILLLMSTVQTIGQLVAYRILQGAFSGTFAASISLVAGVTPRKRIGFALGMMQTAAFMGATIGPFIGGIIADAYGYRAAFRSGAALTFLGGLMVLLWVREKFTPPDKNATANSPGFRQIFSLGGFMTAVAILFAVRFTNSMIAPSFPLIIKEILPSAENLNSITGSAIAVAGVSGAVSAAFLGHMGDRIGHKRILIACCLISTVACIGYFFVATIPALFGIRVLFGISVAGMMPSANAMIQRTVDKKSIGKAYGTATSISKTGSTLGPFFGGTIVKFTNLRVPFLVVAAAQSLMAILIASTMKKKPQKRANNA